MHFERLAIEAGENTFTLDFHERLTVIAGVGRLERDGLIHELIGALNAGRSGVHLELVSDAGTRYAIFRPATGAHLVVDVDRAEDVTKAFTDGSGRVNILQRAGLDDRSARRAMRLEASDLATSSDQERRIESLARIDPGRLWDVARKVKEREARLDEAADAVGSTPEDLGACQEIEARHAEFEAAQDEVERVRQRIFLGAAAAAMLAVPGAIFLGPYVALVLAVAAAGTGAWSAAYWRRLATARRNEEDALAQVGANSYITFQINRVNGLLADDHNRRMLMQAADDHRAAMREWQVLADETPVDWALEHRGEIMAAHVRLREMVGVANPMALTLDTTSDTTAELTAALADRLAVTRSLGAGRESIPTFVDDAFVGIDARTKHDLLEYLLKASLDQQIIYLTDDPDVASWARLEATTGQLAIVEPGGGADRSRQTGDDDNRTRRSRHVAA